MLDRDNTSPRNHILQVDSRVRSIGRVGADLADSYPSQRAPIQVRDASRPSLRFLTDSPLTRLNWLSPDTTRVNSAELIESTSSCSCIKRKKKKNELGRLGLTSYAGPNHRCCSFALPSVAIARRPPPGLYLSSPLISRPPSNFLFSLPRSVSLPPPLSPDLSPNSL